MTGEVLLAAGPYHSPKLLQLSGIGPAAALQSFAISQVVDLPVGESAQVQLLIALQATSSWLHYRMLLCAHCCVQSHCYEPEP